MELTGYNFQTQAEVFDQEGYATFPVAFFLKLAPDSDPTIMPLAAKAITHFIADSRTGGGGYDS